MSVKNKLNFLMKEQGKSRSDIAEALKISEAAVSNKFYRDSFSAEDLIKIADCLGFEHAFINDNQKIIFDLSDIKAGE